MSKGKLQERAKKAAATRARNKMALLQDQTKERITGKLKKLVIYLDEGILKKFDKSRIAGSDISLTSGIRHAMQDYIDKHPS